MGEITLRFKNAKLVGRDGFKQLVACDEDGTPFLVLDITVDDTVEEDKNDDGVVTDCDGAYDRGNI